ncbi:hypothetical protein P154DRAFT_518008 [Amniculicola lignicola CBS 123094]|uniref:DUF4188 domain-containing protein n=1 Tax=Amniculicola lignicola CBS 123094 TaxID=1392246 RepID=A0A6A5WYZ1_9PLEO|nr:hypothetical protein P154DRAFT_518008 [Amniculicola lignicola CBS 123094]
MSFHYVRNKLHEFHQQWYDLIEKSDFSITTFLAFGAVLQLLSFTLLPPRVSLLVPLTWLGYRIIISAFRTRDVGKSCFTDVVKGMHITQMPESSDGIVVFILGARFNHPFGKLAPGMVGLDIDYKPLWREAEKNREKWGFLGRTMTLVDTSDNEGTTNIWISYWKDVKGLHSFATCAEHRVVWDGYKGGKYPYIGIFHELYHVPKGSMEAIYGDFPKYGLGAVKFPRSGTKDQGEVEEVLVQNWKGSNSYARMRRTK